MSVEFRFYDRHLIELYELPISSEDMVPIKSLYVWFSAPWKWRFIPDSIIPKTYLLRCLEKKNPWKEKGGKERKVLWWSFTGTSPVLYDWKGIYLSVEMEYTPPNWVTFGLGTVWGVILSILTKHLPSLVKHLIELIRN